MPKSRSMTEYFFLKWMHHLAFTVHFLVLQSIYFVLSQVLSFIDGRHDNSSEWHAITLQCYQKCYVFHITSLESPGFVLQVEYSIMLFSTLYDLQVVFIMNFLLTNHTSSLQKKYYTFIKCTFPYTLGLFLSQA